MDVFLNPALAYGAALAAVPFILHLIMRQQPKHLLFPALRFIQQRHLTNRRSLRIRNWLLLLLRAAIIGCLAFALARPSIQSAGFLANRESPVAAALIFDTSPHMEYRNENKTRLEAAQETAAWLLGQLPDESQVAVFDSTAGPAAFQVDLAAARHRIDRLDVRGAEPLWKLFPAAVELLKTSDKRREIYVFTDLAKSAWAVDSPDSFQAKLRELRGVGLYLIDVGVEKPQDFSLGDLRFSAQVLAKNSPLVVGTDVSAIGNAGSRTVEAYVVEDGKADKRSEETVDVPDGQTRPIEFRLSGLDLGTHQGYLRLVGGDALAADDMRYFTVEVRAMWKVLVVAPDPADDRAHFLTWSLTPPALRLSGRARFEPQVISYAALEQQELDKYAAIFLLDPPPMADGVWQQLTGFAQAGGGVAIFLGGQAQPDDFNRPAAQSLLPGELTLQARAPDKSVYLLGDESQHPIFAAFRPWRGTLGWEDSPVFRYWRFLKMAEGAGIATIASYSDGRPAIIEKPLKKGRVLVATTPISELPSEAESDPWNWFFVGPENPWPFRMMATEMALYLVGQGHEQLNYLAGQTALVRLEPNQRFHQYVLTTPRGDSETRTADPKENTIVVKTTDLPTGNYGLNAGGKNGVQRGFSINLPAEATQLERVDDDRLKQVFGDEPFKRARNRDEIDREVSTGRVGQELFPLLIAVVALVMGAEHLLANRFHREH
jgi:hypothetical protein